MCMQQGFLTIPRFARLKLRAAILSSSCRAIFQKSARPSFFHFDFSNNLCCFRRLQTVALPTCLRIPSPTRWEGKPLTMRSGGNIALVGEHQRRCSSGVDRLIVREPPVDQKNLLSCHHISDFKTTICRSPIYILRIHTRHADLRNRWRVATRKKHCHLSVAQSYLELQFFQTALASLAPALIIFPRSRTGCLPRQ
jgi:hypothetical protein